MTLHVWPVASLVTAASATSEEPAAARVTLCTRAASARRRAASGQMLTGLTRDRLPAGFARASACLDSASCSLKAVQPDERRLAPTVFVRRSTRPSMSFAAHYALPFPREAAPVAPLVPAVARALTLLDRLARGREPMTLARLSSELALPKSSVHGLCTTLVSFGYLRRQADGSFLIGPRVMGLAEAFVAGTDVAQEFNALWGSERHRARGDGAALGALGQRGALRRRPQQRPAARPRLQRRHAPAGLSLRQRQGDARPAAGRRSPAPLHRPALDPAHQQGPARHRVAAQGAGADPEARLQHRRRGGPRRRLLVRRRRSSTPPARPSPRSRSASTRRSSAAIAARATATPRSTSPAA